MESSLGEIFDRMESRLGEILDRMEAHLLEIIAAAEDKQRAESVSFTTESAADEHFTEFDNEAVPDCVAVTRTNAELAAFDTDLSSFDNKLGGRSRARTDVVVDDGPLFNKEHEHAEAELIPYQYVVIGSSGSFQWFGLHLLLGVMATPLAPIPSKHRTEGNKT